MKKKIIGLVLIIFTFMCVFVNNSIIAYIGPGALGAKKNNNGKVIYYWFCLNKGATLHENEKPRTWIISKDDFTDLSEKHKAKISYICVRDKWSAG